MLASHINRAGGGVLSVSDCCCQEPVNLVPQLRGLGLYLCCVTLNSEY